MKIYTKTGDLGQTSLVGGARVPKSHARIEAYGTLDELNSVIGLIRSRLSAGEGETTTDSLRSHVDTRLVRLQNNLFNLGSQLACEDDELRPKLPDVKAQDISDLETDMDQWEKELPGLKNFILPGGSELAALSHLARTVCRRGERAVIRLNEAQKVAAHHLIFLNRLSDWLFMLARKFNFAAGLGDPPWTKS
jgi:cob(I)alamin adenosyltransferase